MTKSKKVFSLIMALAMIFAFSSATVSAASPLEPVQTNGQFEVGIFENDDVSFPSVARGYNPNFFSGQLYGYNAVLDTGLLISDNTWSYGPVQPPYMRFSKDLYTWLNNNNYNYYFFYYVYNSKDTTYIKIYDTQGNVYIESAVKPNTYYDIQFYTYGGSSRINLKMDWVVDGFLVTGVDIGGLDVIF